MSWIVNITNWHFIPIITIMPLTIPLMATMNIMNIVTLPPVTNSDKAIVTSYSDGGYFLAALAYNTSERRELCIIKY